MTQPAKHCDVCALTANYGSWVMMVLGTALSLLPVAAWVSAVGSYLIVAGLAIQAIRTVYVLARSQLKPRH